MILLCVGQCLGVRYPDWCAFGESDQCLQRISIEGSQSLVRNVAEVRSDGDII